MFFGSQPEQELSLIPVIVSDYEWLARLPERPAWEVQAIVVDTSGTEDDRRCNELLSLLDAEECARADSFKFASDRIAFVVSHAIFRIVLARALGVMPKNVGFATAPRWGHRPRLAEHADRLPFISLSHSGPYVAVAIGKRDPVGIDVECSRALDVWDDVERIILSASERLHLASLRHAPAQRDAILRYWTAKEAALKALGRGLEIPPENAVVRLSPSGSPLAVTVTSDGIQVEYDLCVFDPIGPLAAAASVASIRYQTLRLAFLKAATLLAA